jgi:hypothetical protein
MKSFKYFFIIMFSLFGLLGSKAQTPKSIHSFKVESLDGKTIDFSKFKGKKIVTKGVAETTNSATTVVATDFVDITNAAYGLFYELTPGTSYFTISKAGGNAFNKQSVLTCG